MTRRRRVDVNLEELDQIIDRSQRAPLSESEGEKLKTALHAMAERLQQKRSTEKTSAVLPPDMAAAGKPDTSESAPAGHGRNPASAFRGANKVAVTHPTLHSGDTCPECRRGKLYHQKEPATLVRFVGHAPLEATVFEMERLRCNARRGIGGELPHTHFGCDRCHRGISFRRRLLPPLGVRPPQGDAGE